MIISTGIWCLFSNNIFLNCHISMKGGKVKLTPGLMLKKWPLPDSDGTPLAKKPYFSTCCESCQDGRESSGHGSGNSADSKKKGG